MTSAQLGNPGLDRKYVITSAAAVKYRATLSSLTSVLTHDFTEIMQFYRFIDRIKVASWWLNIKSMLYKSHISDYNTATKIWYFISATDPSQINTSI